MDFLNKTINPRISLLTLDFGNINSSKNVIILKNQHNFVTNNPFLKSICQIKYHGIIKLCGKFQCIVLSKYGDIVFPIYRK